MDDHRPAAALSDAEIERDLERALAVDPSPEFVARVRTRIATEPEPSAWRFSWAILFGSPRWRRAFLARRSASAKAAAPRSWPLAAAVAMAAVVLAVVLMRPDRSTNPPMPAPLAARATANQAATLPDVPSGFSRTSIARPSTSSGRAHTETARGELVEPRARVADTKPLLDPRETRALRSLIAGVRDNRVDLSALFRPGAPASMELAPVDDLVIAPVAIEPIAPLDGAQGVRQ